MDVNYSRFRKAAEMWAGVGRSPARVMLCDLLALWAAVYLGFALRFTLYLPSVYWNDFWCIGALFSACVTTVMLLGRNYNVLWMQASVDDFARYVWLYSLGSLVFVVIRMFWAVALLPRSTLFVFLLGGFVFGGIVRASWRAFVPARIQARTGRRTIIYGAGEAGTLLARDLASRPNEFVLLGFIDDDKSKRRRFIMGLKVLGSGDEIGRIVKDLNVEVVLVAIPSAAEMRVSELYRFLVSMGVSVRVIPSLREIASGTTSITNLREIQLEDLLCRDQVKIDDETVAAALSRRTILVTGAGGSIGSEIVRQLLTMKPERLLLLGHGEQSIYLLRESLQARGVNLPPMEHIIADVADELVMERVFKRWKPQVVFHAAAHKHVPLMQENPLEALRVNALGTLTLARLAGRYGAERMVMISTDKAVNPTSVMGATKRVAELVFDEINRLYPDTRYMAVRFGNVLGSRGSVVPKFKEQIAKGGPVTVTHPDMKRYFMLISEAVSLVLQAGTIGAGGEVFVLDMGEPIKIVDMANMLIGLHGLTPGKDIKVEFTGIRDGEKLFEELFYDMNHVDGTSHPKIFSARLIDSNGVTERVKALFSSSGADDAAALALLHELVHEYDGKHA